MSESKPMKAASGNRTANELTKPRVRVLSALKIKPKRMSFLRPKRSVSAPPIMLPMMPKMENMANTMPASVMPTLKRSVM